MQFSKVIQIYHAIEGFPLIISGMPLGRNGAVRAMTFVNQSIEGMTGYTEESKQDAFFLFGQVLHDVEDVLAPVHIFNDAKNALFAAILRCCQLKNAHVANSTLRFLNSPYLALKQTEFFQSTKNRVMI